MTKFLRFLPVLLLYLSLSSAATSIAYGQERAKRTSASSDEKQFNSSLQNDPAFVQAVEDVLRKNPHIVLDILITNSEMVLEIAQQGQIERQRKIIRSQWENDAKKTKNFSFANAIATGPSSAPVTIVAFSDFTCNFCRQADALLMGLIKQYPQNKIRFVFKPLPREGNPTSLLAAKYITAANLQNSNLTWQYYDKLFAQADVLIKNGESFLKQVASEVGLDVKKLVQDAHGTKVREILTDISGEADKLQVSGTPFFFVNNLTIRGLVTKELYDDAIQTAMRQKK